MKTSTTHLTQLLRDTKEWLAALPSAEESVRRRLFFEALCHATGKILPALQTALCITGLPSAIASDRSFPWAFGDVPDAELGELFLLLRAALLKNHMLPDGLVYTPAWLVDHMVGLLVDRQGMRWCDPACGLWRLSSWCSTTGFPSEANWCRSGQSGAFPADRSVAAGDTVSR